MISALLQLSRYQTVHYFYSVVYQYVTVNDFEQSFNSNTKVKNDMSANAILPICDSIGHGLGSKPELLDTWCANTGRKRKRKKRRLPKHSSRSKQVILFYQLQGLSKVTDTNKHSTSERVSVKCGMQNACAEYIGCRGTPRDHAFSALYHARYYNTL